jgi:hypothetical protein
MSHRITVANLADIHSVLDDLWDGKVKADSFDRWWSDNLGKILKGRIATKIILNKLDGVELDVIG